MPKLTEHSRRFALSNELHARPFPPLETGQSAMILAIKPEKHAARRDKSVDMAHLIRLLDRFGASHPMPEATHHSADMGQFWLKWECHTEFTTYTMIMRTPEGRAFERGAMDVLPQDWLDDIPGVCVSAAILRCEEMTDLEELNQKLADWFVPESLAVSYVLDRAAVVASDLRLDSDGMTRFAIFSYPPTGKRRLGRVMQRLFEIETYKSMSMLGLDRARGISASLGEIAGRMGKITGDMAEETAASEETLHKLLEISAELEQLASGLEFRFGASAAYEAIVNDRISVLREERLQGRQTFGEFMMRRYDPSMRTIKSTQDRLQRLIARAERASNLLRTRVDVERSAQNQALLKSMNERADAQLRLQRTVEGLSVVAISYYAVSLVSYLLYPLGDLLAISKGMITAGITLPVVAIVYWAVRRIRERLE